MKHTFFAILLTLLFSSCSSTFFYSTLNTPNEYVEKVENGDFLLETDSLWIAYCFKGKGGPVQITVFNKSERPLYIDWERSALIVDNVATTYSGKKINYSGDWNSINSSISTDGEYEGTASLPRDISFIPPKTMISEIPFVLNPNYSHIDKNKYKKTRVGGIKSGENITFNVKRIDFDQTNTPLAFKSYLTVYSQPEKPLVFEQDFYLSNVIQTSAGPSSLFPQMSDRGDFFYVEKPANNDALYTTLGIIGGGALIVLGFVYGEPDNSEYDYYEGD